MYNDAVRAMDEGTRPVSEIEMLLLDIDGALSRLTNNTDKLGTSLKPVLYDGPASDMSNEINEKRSTSSPLSNHLYNILTKIETLNSFISNTQLDLRI